MVAFANPLPPSRWVVPVPPGLKDVKERTPLSVANETFQALGFDARPAVQVEEHQSVWAWVHPAGFLAAARGSTLGGGDPVLFSVRLSAVINEGLFPMGPDVGKGYRGTMWSDLSGERLGAYMVPLDPELSSGPGGRGSTLLRALAGLQKKGRLEGFSRWVSETHHDTARQWSCVVGDADLQTIAREVGIDAWLGSLSEELAFSMREREVRRAQGTVPNKTAETIQRSRQRRGIERLEALAQQTRRRYPDSKSLACAQQWMKDSVFLETKARPTLDFHVRSDGLSQAGVLATALREPGSGALLEQWLKKAPEKILAKVVLIPDALGETLVSQLVAAVASYEKGALSMTNVPPEKTLNWVTKSLAVIGERLGAAAIQQSLSAQDGAMGVVLKAWALQRPSDVAAQDAPALIAWMDAHGIPQDWSAAPADVAPRESLQDFKGDFPAYYRHPGESWGAALDRILGDRSVLLEETAGFQSYVRHQELELALPAPAQTGRRGPRF